MIRITLISAFLFSINIIAQNNSSSEFSVMFYNVENLFDCDNDSLTFDDEFTYEGDKHWSYSRYKNKLTQISKVILNVNRWNTPAVIGLCEIENKKVLSQLIYETGLNNIGYKFIHYDSPDKRGIDVALLYQKYQFTPLISYPINLSDSTLHFYTRDALYVKGIANTHDTLHIIVNHWPSKRGGEKASEQKRFIVAKIIKSHTDSILSANVDSKIILIGDFNAELTSTSLQYLLEDNSFHSILNPDEIKFQTIGGSHKYQGHWSVIDHILISSSLVCNSSIHLSHKIGHLNWMLEDDISYSGTKPKRTYSGPRYIKGTSDHLPVILTIEYKKDGEQTLPINP